MDTESESSFGETKNKSKAYKHDLVRSAMIQFIKAYTYEHEKHEVCT